MTDLATIVDQLRAEGAAPVVHTVLADDVGDALITTLDSTMKQLYVAAEDTTYRVDISYCSCGEGRDSNEDALDITLSNQEYHRRLHQQSCVHQVAALNSPMEGQGQCKCGATTVHKEAMYHRRVHVMNRYRCTTCDEPRFMV